MSANLSSLHAAITTARSSRDLNLQNLGIILRRLKASELEMQTFAQLDGDLHELDLLSRRELSLISDGREPTESPTP